MNHRGRPLRAPPRHQAQPGVYSPGLQWSAGLPSGLVTSDSALSATCSRMPRRVLLSVHLPPQPLLASLPVWAPFRGYVEDVGRGVSYPHTPQPCGFTGVISSALSQLEFARLGVSREHAHRLVQWNTRVPAFQPEVESNHRVALAGPTPHQVSNLVPVPFGVQVCSIHALIGRVHSRNAPNARWVRHRVLFNTPNHKGNLVQTTSGLRLGRLTHANCACHRLQHSCRSFSHTGSTQRGHMLPLGVPALAPPLKLSVGSRPFITEL